MVRVRFYDAIITNEINLFGLARVEDECKTQKDLSSTMNLWEADNDKIICQVLKNVQTCAYNPLSKNGGKP